MNKKSFKFEDMDITTIILVVIIVLILYFVFSDDRPVNDPKVFDLNMGLDIGENKEFSLGGRASMDYDSIDFSADLELDNEDKIYGNASIKYDNMDDDGLSLGLESKVGVNDFELGGRTGAYVDSDAIGASAGITFDDDYYGIEGRLDYDDKYGASLNAVGELGPMGVETGYNTVVDDFYLNIEGFQNPGNELDLSGDNKYLVYFYADWCGFCKKFTDNWEALKKSTINDKTGETVILKEFESSNKEMMEKYNIKGYPTIKLISKNKVIDYELAREVSAIKSWVSTN